MPPFLLLLLRAQQAQSAGRSIRQPAAAAAAVDAAVAATHAAAAAQYRIRIAVNITIYKAWNGKFHDWFSSGSRPKAEKSFWIQLMKKTNLQKSMY